MIRFSCPTCGRSLKAELAAAGKHAKCGGCGTAIEIPQASQTPEPEPVFVDEPPTFQVPRFKPTEDDEIDMTPMIDVVFQLLIFFMVTAAMSLQKSLPAPVPEQQQASAVQSSAVDDAVTIRVEADDSLWVDDAMAVSRQDLIAKLRKLRAAGHSGTGRGLPRLVVSASPDAHHEAVVTALDAGGAAGMEEISLVTEEEP
ncbi:MAG: biopolymer transporter ExbD [Pirellulales bacterium]